VRVTFLGVRGSTPAPGEEFLRYGGHTSCVAIAHDGEAPTLLLDAGTGIRRTSSLMNGAPFRSSIFCPTFTGTTCRDFHSATRPFEMTRA